MIAPASARRIMPIDRIPDWRRRIERVDACLDRAILDRPVVWCTVWPREPRVPWPARKSWNTIRDRWMDVEWVADVAYAAAMNAEYLGDALPATHPNLGPEVFSAFFGAELEFSNDSSWSIPCLRRWEDAGKLEFSTGSPYWQKMEELYDALLARGRGVFYTGITDLHPGGDAIAAFRDPETFAVDMIEARDEVRTLLARVNEAYFRVFDHYCGKLEAAAQPITSWHRYVTTRRQYVPSNDFSCMISKAMFDDVFLPGIREECRHTGASVYHLDGPDAIRHLDSLLAIPELNAIQWVCGAGKGPVTRWLDLLRRIQDAGKGVQVLDVHPHELDAVMQALRPEGVWLDLAGVGTRDEGEALIRKVERWGKR